MDGENDERQIPSRTMSISTYIGRREMSRVFNSVHTWDVFIYVGRER